MLRNPEAALDLVRALQEARDYASSRREDTCNWVGEETGEDPLLVCQAMKTDRIFQAGENVKPEPELIGELERLAKFALDYKLIEKLPDISAKFDLTFVEKVLNDQGRKTN
jgi:ABC-type nitrate/sulfonate/bicarbonate transport system substrate-binding protein